MSLNSRNRGNRGWSGDLLERGRWALVLSLRASTIALPIVVVSSAALSSGCSTTAKSLEVGSVFPGISATDHRGQKVEVPATGPESGPTLVYFYPKDSTPGCTKEACALRDVWQRYEEAGIVVLGVSKDDAASHEAFAKEHGLPFGLIADEDGAWAKAFGVSSTAGFHARVSYLIAADGKVLARYDEVDPGTHAVEVLDDYARLSGTAKKPE